MHHLTEKQIQHAIKAIVKAIVKHCLDKKIQFLFTNCSGGLDSAVMVALSALIADKAAKQDYMLTSVGVMQICNDPSAETRARIVIQKYGAQEMRISIADPYNYLVGRGKFDNELRKIEWINYQLDKIAKEANNAPKPVRSEPNRDVPLGNLKARLRMMLIYYMAERMNGLVLSSENISKRWMGAFTLHGNVGDFAPLRFLLKGSELKDIARFLDIPPAILNAPPDDGQDFSPDGYSDLFGMNFAEWEDRFVRLIRAGFDPDGKDEQLEHLPDPPGTQPFLSERLARRCLANKDKRRCPLTLTRAELGLPEIKDLNLD